MKKILSLLFRLTIKLIKFVLGLVLFLGIFVSVVILVIKMENDKWYEAKEAVSDYVRLPPESYLVLDVNKLKSNSWNASIRYIDGIEREKMYYYNHWRLDMWGEKSKTGIYVAPDSGISEPLFEFAWYSIGFTTDDNSNTYIKTTTSEAYFSIIKNALNTIENEDSALSYDAYRSFYVFFDPTENFHFKGTVKRIKANDTNETCYVLRVYLDGKYREYPLEDMDGFYDWLDENVFKDTEENGDDTDGEAAAAE